MTTRPHLLVLEDDATSGALIELLASRNDAVTRVTRSADEFLDLLTRWPATHLTLDLKLPGIDGVQVLNMLAQRRCRIPVLIVSSVDERLLASVKRVASAQHLSIYAAISKPFEHAVMASFLASSGAAAKPAQTPLPMPVVTRAALDHAITTRQFRAFYQPKVRLNDGAIQGYEALARWFHPRLGLVRPDAFITAMERLGCIDRLTDSIMHSSLQWLSEHGPRLAGQPVSVAFNVSAQSFADPALTDRLLDACARWSLDPERVELEVTESSAMRNPTAALTTLTRLRLSGFSLALDDFGTGYSSMLHLARLPFTSLKLDHSFVHSIREIPESRKIVASMTSLGRSLGLTVVGEGVESQAVADALGELGCDYAQGYLYSPPLPAEQVDGWHAQWLRQHASAPLAGAAA